MMENNSNVVPLIAKKLGKERGSPIKKIYQCPAKAGVEDCFGVHSINPNLKESLSLLAEEIS